MAKNKYNLEEIRSDAERILKTYARNNRKKICQITNEEIYNCKKFCPGSIFCPPDCPIKKEMYRIIDKSKKT